jgi:hypothetical protein
MFNPHSTEENSMKKLGYVIAVLGAIAIVAPSIASAETVVVKHGDRANLDARAEMHHGGWRHHHHHHHHGH